MRIEFLKAVDVDRDSVPRSAWGRLQIRTTTVVPSFAVDAGEEVKAEAKPIVGSRAYYFRKGAIVELPDSMAADYVADGSAKVYINPRGAILFGVERPE